MNTPNKLSVLRIILLPVIMFFYLSSSFIFCGKLIAAGIFLLAVFTDWLDGKIARKYNQITTLGKFLDSIADKMLVVTALILIIADKTILAPFGAVVGIVIICRELLVSALRQMGAARNVIIVADMWGKIKANFQFFALFFFIIFSFFIDNAVLSTGLFLSFQIFCYALMGITVVATILSGVHYILKNKAVLTE